jgi:hypothetical protein
MISHILLVRSRYIVVQIGLAQIWPFLSVLAIPIFLYFIKLELRTRKLEELEHKLAIESRIQKLETDPVFMSLKQIDSGDAVDLYLAAKEKKNEPK